MFCTGININCDGDVLDVDKAANVVYDGSHHFVAVTVDGDTLRAIVDATVAGNGNDTPERIDEFTIVKPNRSRGEGEGRDDGEAEGEGEGEGGGAEEGEGEGEGEGAGEGEEEAGEDDEDGESAGEGNAPERCDCHSAGPDFLFAAVVFLLGHRPRLARGRAKAK